VLLPLVVSYILFCITRSFRTIVAWLDETLSIVVAFPWMSADIAAGIMSFPLLACAMRLS